MKISQLFVLFLGSLLACEAKVSLRPRGRYLTENTTSSAASSTSTGKSNVTYASRTDDSTDDDGASLKDDSKTEDDADTGNNSKPFVFVHKKGSSMLDATDDNVIFTPPREIEPPFWKPFVAGFFLFLALLLCVITAGKRCCKANGYREIPSTTLVV
jgi:hypothetical protein